ncbi:hypothetical protein O1611_g2558 [Lasiodiplodia mahajangana]|uniref:Uncharacterized protein n=1 Tax=Lasiodiplodia mahajangana TaxID=1108764 RepID=A0ACC2JUJ3_9PEZI|nr:hypothetical protein O1611_g2558 [Lasiodiplodia mahajangana]
MGSKGISLAAESKDEVGGEVRRGLTPESTARGKGVGSREEAPTPASSKLVDKEVDTIDKSTGRPGGREAEVGRVSRNGVELDVLIGIEEGGDEDEYRSATVEGVVEGVVSAVVPLRNIAHTAMG